MEQPGKSDEKDFLSGVVKKIGTCLGTNTEAIEVDYNDNLDYYNFNHTKRGIAVVVVNEKFEGHSKRAGAELDRELLSYCFRSLGFDVRVFTDLNGFQLVTEMEKIALEMTRDPDFDCFVFAMSSHGDKIQSHIDHNTIVEEDVIYATDGYIPTERILKLFSDEICIGLIGKPRLFFLQACRGNLFDIGTTVIDEVDSASDKMVITRIPCFKDYLVMYATPPG
ncbi:hypothetical protein LOTGIDRAFT_154123 [Lottia gigantea]|uniref:Caspase family p20 domain-containing protein n=1 Tax=Lottia gigantea TaxID=225164 RepID=V4A6Z8_LOTGI|nr:hypothetical protein LOTGIDRAFT_154123 [Lottia gigantea]ESO89046.1 hypothetical protein LOTGIDRAFT_154123 [Lottia gigantea]